MEYDTLIELADGSALARQARACFAALARRHDLRPYLFTGRIRIDPAARPHSHPVLTLNAEHVEEPERFLAVFLNLEMRWCLERQTVEPALVEGALRAIFPGLAAGTTAGGSAPLRLAAAWLEFRALIDLLGRAAAQRVVDTHRHDRRIYDLATRHEIEIGALLQSLGLRLP
ncbi:MAG TPA: hypothetical protein VEH84_08025 [Alphaproteobacteria bacterium]|nr:hypothetical protein [Alphaproteobacteria bacterium]